MVALALAIVATWSTVAAAQDPVTRADHLMRVGRVFAAESVYYWAATSQPRDPRARMALGRYLASRGALKTAATLMEEARSFGAETAAVALELAAIYEQLGEYRALAALPGSPLSAAARLRAEWLRDNRPTRRGPVATTVALRPSESHVLGAVVLRIGRDSIIADIDVGARGLALDTSWVRSRLVRRFVPPGDGAIANAVGVVTLLEIGDLTLGNVPVSFTARGDAKRAVVGLEFLARFAPTFDERSSTLTLRPGGRPPARPRGRRLPTLAMNDGYRVVNGTTLIHIAGSDGRALLGGARWTLLPGEVIVD